MLFRSIGVSSPGGSHLDTKTRPHPTACRLQCWDTSAQTSNRMGERPRPSADRLPSHLKSTATSKHTPSQVPVLHLIVGRHQSLPPGNLHKPLDQLHPPGGRNQKQEELQSCSLWDRKHEKLDKMGRQRNMFQMKEQDNTPEEQLREVEIDNLPEKEIRVMTVKMFQDL